MVGIHEIVIACGDDKVLYCIFPYSPVLNLVCGQIFQRLLLDLFGVGLLDRRYGFDHVIYQLKALQ